MIITCPNCKTRFNVDPGRLLPNGRTVRCAKCGHLWNERPPGDMHGTLVATEASERGRIPSQPAARDDAVRLRPVLAWGAAALVAAALLGIGVTAREKLQTWWPPSQALSELAGLTGNEPGAGLEIRNLTYRHEGEGQASSLVVTGEIVNRSDRVIDIPKLRAGLYDGRGREIHAWFFATKLNRLAPREAVPIISSILESPSGVQRIDVRFVE